MTDLPAILSRLCELEPDRFASNDEPYALLDGVLCYLPDDAAGHALLSAALQELISEQDWSWARLIEGAVWIDGPANPHRHAPISHAEPEGQPFALVLARAVIEALEATRG